MNQQFNQQQIQIANVMYTCRDQAYFILGEGGFRKELEKWRPVFFEVMERKRCSEIVALIELLNAAKNMSEDGMLMHILIAIGCELTEPKYLLGNGHTVAVDEIA